MSDDQRPPGDDAAVTAKRPASEAHPTDRPLRATVRPIDRERDRRGVLALDTSFSTDVIFDVVVAPRSIALVERRLPAPRLKRFPIAEVFADWAMWETGFVAERDGVIVGFAGCAFVAWHRRMVLEHLYVAPSARGEGVGRALLAAVEAEARRAGARHVWLETSNLNVPGVAAWERMGFVLCGADTTLYDGYAAGEQALFMTRPL